MNYTEQLNSYELKTILNPFKHHYLFKDKTHVDWFKHVPLVNHSSNPKWHALKPSPTVQFPACELRSETVSWKQAWLFVAFNMIPLALNKVMKCLLPAFKGDLEAVKWFHQYVIQWILIWFNLFSH